MKTDNKPTNKALMFGAMHVTQQTGPTLSLFKVWAEGGKPEWLIRGYTSHENCDEFGLINMNGRLYDPVLGRMLSPDNFVQDPSSSQSYNRYSYCWNNPLKYTDPSGEIVITTGVAIGIAVGVLAGGYVGYNIADSKGYDFNNWQTYASMLGGVAIEGLAAYGGAVVAGAGGIMASTQAIIFVSTTFSFGTSMLSGMQMPVTTSFGGASLNWSTSEVGFLGKSGNSTSHDIGHAFGAMANVQDIFAWDKGVDIQVLSRKKLGGHHELRVSSTAYTLNDITISVSPKPGYIDKFSEFDNISDVKWETQFFSKWVEARNIRLIDASKNTLAVNITNINGNILAKMTNNLSNGNNLLGIGSFKYGILKGCVNYSARALMFSGVPTLNAFLPITSPLFLNFELFIRQIGISASPYLAR